MMQQFGEQLIQSNSTGVFNPIHKRPHLLYRHSFHAKNNHVVVERWEIDVTAVVYAALNSYCGFFRQQLIVVKK